MEVLKISPRKLKELIEEGQFIGKGHYGSVFTYQDRLIKLDNILYDLLKNNDIALSEKKVYYRYLGGREDFDSEEQIYWLSEKQKDVKLTKLPQGILKLTDAGYSNNGIIPGIIIPYHKDYDKLENLPIDDKKRVYLILKSLLEKIKELEDNQISQEDLYHPTGINERDYNVLYKDYNPEIIDLSGVNVLCGKKFQNAKCMYIDLGHIIIDFLEYYKLPSPYHRWYTESYEKNIELIKVLKEVTK